VPGRVLPEVERALRRVGTGDQVLALPGVVAVAEGGHALERVAAQRIGVAEVVVDGHVVAHPVGRVVDLSVEGEGAQAVLRPVVVDDGEERLLLAIDRGVRPRAFRHPRDGHQRQGQGQD
jgi:hypothetical protein